MGLTPGSDYSTGVACSTCFDPDNPIGWQNPPEYILAVVSGATPCLANPVDPNGNWLLTKDGQCFWKFEDVDWFVGFAIANSIIFPFTAYFSVINFGVVQPAFIGWGPNCSTIIANQNVIADCGHAVSAWGGSAVMSWGPGIGP